MTSELSKEEKEEIGKINQLTRVSMACLWRFAPIGHPYFDNEKPYYKVFIKRFNELGGFTPEISKFIDC